MSVQPALVRAIYPRSMLGRGLGFNTTVVATSLAAGPSIGAALLSISSWPILFAATRRSASSPSCCRSATCRAPRTLIAFFDMISAVLSGATFGLLIFGIDGMGMATRARSS